MNAWAKDVPVAARMSAAVVSDIRRMRPPLVADSLLCEELSEYGPGPRHRLARPRAICNTARHTHARLEVGRRLVEHHLVHAQIELRVVGCFAHRRRQLRDGPA